MWKTILRRLLIMIPQLIILSLLVFLLAKMMPGDPFSGSINPNTDPKQIEALRRAAGLYDPWYVQYCRWVGNLFHGDLGTSYIQHVPVVSLFLWVLPLVVIKTNGKILLYKSLTILLWLRQGSYSIS